jgi:hypothetical protein
MPTTGRGFDPDGPLDANSAKLLGQLEEMNRSFETPVNTDGSPQRKEYSPDKDESTAYIVEDHISVEDSIELNRSPDNWLSGEANSYLKTDEAKRFKALMEQGIEVRLPSYTT